MQISIVLLLKIDHSTAYFSDGSQLHVNQQMAAWLTKKYLNASMHKTA